MHKTHCGGTKYIYSTCFTYSFTFVAWFCLWFLRMWFLYQHIRFSISNNQNNKRYREHFLPHPPPHTHTHIPYPISYYLHLALYVPCFSMGSDPLLYGVLCWFWSLTLSASHILLLYAKEQLEHSSKYLFLCSTGKKSSKHKVWNIRLSEFSDLWLCTINMICK